MDKSTPPKDRKGLRTGFTTGACAAAAAKAAARCLVKGVVLAEIETTLPNRSHVTFALARCERLDERAICSVIKDAGDDPDCTHGAELMADVELRTEPGIEIRGGCGVARVTKAGLGLKVDGPAINPVPSRNITEMVEEELVGSPYAGAVVTITVPDGEEMAKKTTNARLGLLGGISILGTTGIVRPYSTAAFKASVMQEIDVAAVGGLCELVFTTGGKSEHYAMALYPRLPEQAFIQVGDFIGVGVKQCAKRGVTRAIIVGMMGKLSKMANGKMQTHAAGSDVDMEFLASLAAELSAPDELVAAIRQANTARHVLELCREAGLVGITSLICRKVADQCQRHAGGRLIVEASLVDFGGALLGRYPEVHE
ncbi:MAG: cobalt-precorrin-5B (C(1))-methyltransferase [Nitrospira sp. HN-bin3]|uniref:cobalt-precorrin-5B (C(1))-methyltransferase n=1 Tax=Nitrospira cf. moscoviensis SBR1015 TaxID=96242 RepID=UPI000A0E9536|nr:cobalt-precorrin-5B (C(1))-methyltransferase [Nitrospira cf. moscoviensis SBR1015]OQW49945.1 MAG: cobalt-precorrin-5B (C(1))-methyltransferase [Nitrospira sp. HN-bin3]